MRVTRDHFTDIVRATSLKLKCPASRHLRVKRTETSKSPTRREFIHITNHVCDPHRASLMVKRWF
jgi:hypothetical protein